MCWAGQTGTGRMQFMEGPDMDIPAPPVGASARRLEDPQLVQGTAQYLDDLQLPGVLSVAFVRCPLAHAMVQDLSLDHARKMPGVVAAFGPRDLPALSKPIPPMNREPGWQERTPSALADGEVRYAGEAVAVVVADDPYRAADAADAVQVSYDELLAVVDATEALQDGAPQVHADVAGNVVGHLSFSTGDVDAALAQADVIIREHFSTQRVSNASIEPRGVAAQPVGTDSVILWSSTQAPHVVRHCVAGALGLSTEQVRVITPFVGGGFGPKGRPYPEETAIAVLALHLRRPCRWEATRHEDFLSTYQGHGVTADAELAARSDGTILGLRAKLIQDAGAYLVAGGIVPQYALEHLIGPYHVPAAHLEAVTVYTNKAQLTPLRGGGREQGVFISERLLDHLAHQIGVDPIDVRQRNLVHPDEFPYDTHVPKRSGGTIVYDSGDFPAYLDEVRGLIGYDEVRRAQSSEREAGTYRGIAITLYVESTAMGKEGARVAIQDDGSVVLAVGSPDVGQSHRTTMSQICAAMLGIPAERITFVSGDTDAMSVGSGTFASRFAVMAGNATALAAQEVVQRAVAVAVDLLDTTTPQALEICGGVVRVATAPDQTVTLAEVAQRARATGVPLDVTYVFAPETATTYAGGAQAAVVEVDVETGRVTVERYAAVHDSGTVINPAVVEGQYHGGITLGLGQALGEMIAYNGAGRLLTDSFQRYLVPHAEQVPRFTVKGHPCRSRNNPVGIKGVGEGGTMGALATIVGAVEDALAPLSLKLNNLPLRFEGLARMCAPLQSPVPDTGGE